MINNNGIHIFNEDNYLNIILWIHYNYTIYTCLICNRTKLWYKINNIARALIFTVIGMMIYDYNVLTSDKGFI